MNARTEKLAAGSTPDAPPVIDYEGSGYRTDFWEGQSRQYEDRVERLALQELLPRKGGRIAEIGAGFGRLADLYAGYDQVILFDYSRTLLQEAVERWGHDPRFVFVAGNVYDLPIAAGSLDTLVMVRVMHHLVDVPRALSQLRRALHRDSVAVVEYANKRNLKAWLRWLLGRQQWSPIDSEPVEFVHLNFVFHPAWMQRRFQQAYFRVTQQWAVSHFRLAFLKRVVPVELLATLDRRLFGIGGKYPLAPSVFVRLTPDATYPLEQRGEVDAQLLSRPDEDALKAKPQDKLAAIFCCPCCCVEGTFERLQPDRLVCGVCDTAFERRAQIWDFKEPAGRE